MKPNEDENGKHKENAVKFDPSTGKLEGEDLWLFFSSRFDICEAWLSDFQPMTLEEAGLYRLHLELKDSKLSTGGAVVSDQQTLFHERQNFGFADFIPTNSLHLYLGSLVELNVPIPEPIEKKISEIAISELREFYQTRDWRDIITKGIAARSLTPQFLVAWEHYHAAISNLTYYNEHVAPFEFTLAYGQKTNEGFKAWCCLLKSNMEDKLERKINRKELDIKLGEFLFSIVKGKVNIPSGVNPIWLKKWIVGGLVEENGKVTDKIRPGFTSKHTAPTEKNLLWARSLKRSLPPSDPKSYF